MVLVCSPLFLFVCVKSITPPFSFLNPCCVHLIPDLPSFNFTLYLSLSDLQLTFAPAIGGDSFPHKHSLDPYIYIYFFSSPLSKVKSTSLAFRNSFFVNTEMLCNFQTLSSFKESWVLSPFQRCMTFPSSSLRCLTPSRRNQSPLVPAHSSPLRLLLCCRFRDSRSLWKALTDENLCDLYAVKFKQYLNYIMSYTNPYSVICTSGYAESL